MKKFILSITTEKTGKETLFFDKIKEKNGKIKHTSHQDENSPLHHCHQFQTHCHCLHQQDVCHHHLGLHCHKNINKVILLSF